MIVLDTNIISELMKPTPEPSVIAWLDRQSALSIWTTSVCVFEVRAGLNTLAAGQRQRRLTDRFETFLEEGLRGRVLSLDTQSANAAASILADCKSRGTPIDFRDLLIAGIVAATRATLATRNTRHFAPTGVALVDPWNP